MADFRENNPTALQALFRAFVLLGRQLDRFGAELLAIDGSKFKAGNSKHTHFTKAKLEQALKGIDTQVDQYLSELAASDREAASVHQPPKEELQEKSERLKERQPRYRGFLQEIAARGATPLALTDPASRSMPKSPQGDVGYNVQIAVDSKHTLMVEQDVTHAVTDDDQLRPVASRAQKTLGVERMRVVADRGYSHGHEIKAWEEAGIKADVPKPSTSANTKLGLVGKERCTYAPDKDGYRCPQGAELTCRCETTALGRPIRYYATAACRGGALQEQCTRNKGGRRLPRWGDEHIRERMEERFKANPEIMQERKHLVAPPFGTIKHANEQGYCLTKGRKNVRAEFSRSCLAYHLKRVINSLGVPHLLVALGEGGPYDTCASGRERAIGISLAQIEHVHMSSRDLIRLPDRSR